VREDLTIRDMTDLMETMNGDHIIARSRMTEAVIGPMEIAKTAPVMTIVTEDMATARVAIIITVREEGTTTTVKEDTATIVRLLMETTVLLMGIIIITVHTEIMIANTTALARKDIATGL
jgi:hypothetical protein